MDEGETIAQGDDDLLDTRVLLNAVVKGEDALSLSLALGLGVNDLAGPQGIVGNDETAIVQAFHCQVIVLDILALVGVDEHEVKAFAQLGDNVAGITDVEGDAAALVLEG